MDFDDESVSTQVFRYNDDGDISTQPPIESAQGVNNIKVQVGQLHTEDKIFPIYKGINIIGRDKLKCDIVLPSLTVSKRHAEIEADSRSNVFICDIGSSNGTLLNNTLLRKNKMYQILDQNVIQIGEISAKYKFLNGSKNTSSIGIQKPIVEQKNDTSNIKTSSIITTIKPTIVNDEQHDCNVSRASSKGMDVSTADSLDDIFDMATQKSVCVNDHPVEKRNKSDIIAEESIFYMETQKVGSVVDHERKKQLDSVVEDSIFDAETQNSVPVSIVEESIFNADTQKPSEVRIDKESVHSESLVESSIFDAATQKFDKQSMEKGIDGVAHSTPLREDHKFTVPRKPPLKSLNISAIEPSKIAANQTNLYNSKTERNLDQSDDIFDAETQQLKPITDQDMSIYDAPTQCLSSKAAESLNSNDSDTDEEGLFDAKSSKRSETSPNIQSLIKFDDKNLSIFDAPTQNIKQSQRVITDESSIKAQILKEKESSTAISDCNESSNESICLLETQSAREFLSKNADISEINDTCVTRKIVSSDNSKNCNIYEAATQKLNTLAEDDDDSDDTDEESTFLDKVRANNCKEFHTKNSFHIIDTDIFDAPTQKMGEMNFDNDDIYDAPTQMTAIAPLQVTNIFDAPTQKMNVQFTTVIASSDSDTDQEGIFESKNSINKTPVEMNKLVNNIPTSDDENIFDAVTQKIVVQQDDVSDSETDEEGEFRAASRKQTAIEINEHEQDDDIFDIPTQLMSCRKIDFEQHDSDSDIDMVPTQKLESKQQQLDDDMTDKSKSEEDADLSEQQHLLATQKMNDSIIVLDSSSNDAFQVKEKNESVKMAPSPIGQHDSDSDIDMVATQKLESSHNKTNNSTILLDTSDDVLSSAGPIEEKLLKMVGESSGFKGSSPMLTQQLVDILEPSQQQQNTELESSPIVRSRMRLKRTPKKCVTSSSIEDNLKGLLGEPQQTDDLQKNVSPQMLTQQIVDILESQPTSTLEVVQEKKTVGSKRKNQENTSQVPKTKRSRRCATIQDNSEGYVNLRPRRKRNLTEKSDEENLIQKAESKQVTRPKKGRKIEQASDAGESSGTLRLSLTKRNDVWESIPTKSPDSTSSKQAPATTSKGGLAKVPSTRPRGRPRGSTKKKSDQVSK